MSGLTVGMMGIDHLVLELKIESRDTKPEEWAAAKRLLPILQKHHYLLVTLLLINASALETLPIYLDKLVPSVWAIIISVTCVLWVGEILPMAVCTGSNQIMIANKLAPLVNMLMIGTGIISYPLSLMLDCILGEDHQLKWFSGSDLKTLIDLHSKKAISEIEEEMGASLGLKGLDIF